MSELEFLPGYVRNEGKRAYFKLQHSLPPEGKLSLEQAFLVIGKQSGLERGPEFTQWLRETHFAGPDWVFYDEHDERLVWEVAEAPTATEVSHAEAPMRPPVVKAKGAGRKLRRQNLKIDENKITPAQIIDADPAQAKNLIEQCRDKTVLKKAMALTSHFAHKEEHQRYLMRRLEQV